jgi:RNA polymerase sigma-54 factor
MKQQAQLSQRQNQKLSPQLQLTLRLLQCTHAELEQEIEQALSVNPVLERREEESSDSEIPASEAQADGDSPDNEAGTQETEPAGNFADADWNTLFQPPDLRQHLREQLHLSTLSARDRVIAEALVDSLEEDGYCLAKTGDIAVAAGLQPNPEADEIEAVRHFIRQLDPLGVASRSLSECLQVQIDGLSIAPELSRLAKRVAEGHLNDLAKGSSGDLAKRLKVLPEQLAAAIGLLKSLDPKPGARFQVSRTDYIEPDFHAVKRAGRWQASAARESRQMALRINSQYRKMARTNSDHAQHLAPYLQEANWLIAAIKARQETLKRVMQAICQRQQLFFEQGPTALAPMRLGDIATALDMHESSISRACSGKYLATRHGLFALSRLFRSGMADQQGQMQSMDALQARIAALIAGEDPMQPLSDMQLVACLQAEGMPMARRTVAKYREALQIAPSHLRRKRPAQPE